jgi:hypothetical protein
MSVASISTTSSLYEFLQSINPANQTSSSNTLASTIANVAQGEVDNAEGQSSTTGTEGTSGHHHHGHHHGLSAQAQQSITSALQSAPAGSDPNQVIQNALKQLLAGNSSSSAGQTGNGNTTTTSTTPADGASNSPSAFTSLLQSYGVDPQQLNQDIQAAIAGTQQSGGSVNYSALFQNLPPGSIVNTTA